MKKPTILILLILGIFVILSGIFVQYSRLNQQIPKLEDMTLRQKVGQLFCVRLESYGQAWPVTELKDTFLLKYKDYPCGGFLMAQHHYRNKSKDQIRQYNAQIHGLYGHPYLTIDEEGGRVINLANIDSLGLPKVVCANEIGQTNLLSKAYESGRVIGWYLKDYGLDMTFAPVADVWTNPDNKVIGNRSYSDNPFECAAMCRAFREGANFEGIITCYKHYPGHGNTLGDSHVETVYTDKNWEELLQCELIPFQDGIAHGLEMIMVAHVNVENVTHDTIPASLSYELLTNRLRGELGYKGIIISDSFGMRAVSGRYTPAQAAVMAIQAGMDIVLGPRNYFEAFDGVVQAVENGEISEARINESVQRVLELKRKHL